MTLAALRTLTTDLVRAPSGKISSQQLDDALQLALSRFQDDRPLRESEDVHATGGLDLPLPSGWEDGSALLALEYPVGRFPQALLRADEFAQVGTPAGDVIRMACQLNAGEAVRVFYSRAHELTETACTIPKKDSEAFCCWAAGLLCDQIAGTFASNSAPSIQVDSADTSNPAREWRTRANSFRSRYAALLGVQGVTGGASDKPQAKPAGTVVEFDLQASRYTGRRMR